MEKKWIITYGNKVIEHFEDCDQLSNTPNEAKEAMRLLIEGQKMTGGHGDQYSLWVEANHRVKCDSCKEFTYSTILHFYEGKYVSLCPECLEDF